MFSHRDSPLDDQKRRDHLIKILSLGAFGMVAHSPAHAWLWSSGAKKVEDDKSIYSLQGEVKVNGRVADLDTRIGSGDSVTTQDESEVIFVVGGDSFIMRSNSEMTIEGAGFFIDTLRMISGSVLSVFAQRSPGQAIAVESSTATIGIRGTGVYMEMEPDLTYVCTCYGQVALASSVDPNDAQVITTTNHDEPRYITSKSAGGTRIRKAPVKNHSDTELKLLEAIVGRKVPKGFGAKSYAK
jgi:hypothetical protein